jgi:hypothetical protein
MYDTKTHLEINVMVYCSLSIVNGLHSVGWNKQKGEYMRLQQSETLMPSTQHRQYDVCRSIITTPNAGATGVGTDCTARQRCLRMISGCNMHSNNGCKLPETRNRNLDTIRCHQCEQRCTLYVQLKHHLRSTLRVLGQHTHRDCLQLRQAS